MGVGVRVDSDGSGRVAPESDALGVPSKGRDVVFDPLRREADILEAEVLLVECGAVGEAEDVYALRDCELVGMPRVEDHVRRNLRIAG